MADDPFIVFAARNNDLAGVQRAIERGDDINALNDDHDTALTWASYLGHTEIVKALLDNGADITIANKYGATPLKLTKDFKKPEAQALLEMAELSPRENWFRMGASAVALIGVYPDQKQKLTTIFNFTSRDRIVISENLEHHTQAVGPATSFDDLPLQAVTEAFAQFEKRGGTADAQYVMYGTAVLAKPKAGPA